YTAGRFLSMEVFELPFMTNRAEPASRAAWQYYEQFGKEDFANVKPLAFHVHDEGYVHNNKHPITKMSDFRGLKMRAPTRMTNKMIAAFGATPVAMPMPAVAEAVSKGVVDGYVLPWEVIPAIKLHELTKFHSETDKSMPSLYTALFIIAMNPAKYDSLPDDLKKVIDANSGADFSASIGKAWDESAPPAREKAVAHGNAFATISVEELSKWRKVGDKLSASWAKEMDGKGYKGQAMLDTAKALIQKANAQ
ncbi:MAG TPA: TRAP transporter substrate-binding protein, partial [Denitromonas sp.]|nr:TRAP transporter substrate-binding protein [Denitromonas sp.]